MKFSQYSLIIGVCGPGLLACGNSSDPSQVSGSGGTAAAIGGVGGGSATGGSPAGSGSSGTSDLLLPPDLGGSSGMDPTCDAGVCACASSNTTTIEGFVYDPAGKNPLYNVSVYVPDPSSPLPDLDNVPLGCGCSQLYPAKVLAVGNPSDATGHFVIPCAPSGTVSLVVQTGKWRMRYDGIAVTANQSNMAPKLRLPANSSEGSLPNIAISTGGSDSLECLPLRIGVAASEYALGSATGGHIHIYTGFHGATMEQGSAASYQTLWDQQAHLNEHDVMLLSCEGQETTGGTPGMPLNSTAQTYLMNYANAGGRVFASHFQYAWFNTGPFGSGANQLATWNVGMQQINDRQAITADIVTTLPGGAPFPEGSALQQWLNLVGATTANQLPIWFARTNVKALAQPPSTEWIHIDANAPQAASSTQYFSADTPIGAAPGAVCGRVVYSDVHVSGGPGTNAPGVAADYPNSPPATFGGGQGGIVPSECATHALTPQEAALEFMLFDLSSCLVPIGQTVMPPPVVK